MNIRKLLVLAALLMLPIGAQAQTNDYADIGFTDFPEDELVAYYDLRNRSTYVQVTNRGSFENPDQSGTVCIHVQIFQQDRGCSELNFNDELTLNDTHIYDLDNLVRNNGTQVPASLLDDSYGYVVINAEECDNPGSDDGEADAALIGNARIVDNAGYEYRYNLVGESDEQLTTGGGDDNGHIEVHFNTIDGAGWADVVGFVYDEAGGPDETTVRNVSSGITFSIFQFDQNEEPLSCDQKTFACGGTMNYGINEDYPNSRDGSLLCPGGGLAPGQTHGFVSLEDAVVNDGDTTLVEEFEFVCLVGINNGNGTGSMDECFYRENGPM